MVKIMNMAWMLVIPALGTILLSGYANAQLQEDLCNKNVAEICGNMHVTQCFDKEANWKLVHPKCEGELQTLIEMEHEVKQAMRFEGASLGGKIRSGPSTSDSQIGSLAKGDIVLLDKNTGVMFRGYPWFQINRYDDKTGKSISGYQWGGILCSFEGVPGVFNNCPIEWSKYASTRLEKSSNNSVTQQDSIALAHGNIDVEIIAQQHLVMISQCINDENNAGRGGIACVGLISDECLDDENNQTTLGMQQCINFERAAWDTKLNMDYQELIALQDTDAKKIILRDAMRLWIEFAAPFCQLSSKLNGGSLSKISGVQCMTDLTAQQVVQLMRLRIGPN